MYCDFDGPEFFNETFQKSRKEYKCCECGYEIKKGEKYWRSVGKWDGEIQVYKQHKFCRAACTHLSKLNWDGCIPFGYMMDEWNEINDTWTKEQKLKYKMVRHYMAKVKLNIRRLRRVNA